jgi:hypothetical protein
VFDPEQVIDAELPMIVALTEKNIMVVNEESLRLLIESTFLESMKDIQ